MAASDQHKIDSGFGGKSEPSEVLEGMDLSGRVALVTGGYSGIGLETTRALVDAGARVHVPARSMGKATDALTDLGDRSEVVMLGEDVLLGEGVVLGEMDLADLDRVRSYARAVRNAEEELDLLINNAGVMACPETWVGPGWEMQFAVNHLGHFVLTTELLPLLQRADDPRVVALSSVGHKRSDIRWDDIHFQKEPYEKWDAYGQSKTANALFALGLDMKYRDAGIRAFSVHPGGIMTPLQRHLSNEEMAAFGWTDEDGNLTEEAKARFKTPAQGASTTLWAATSPALDGMGGLYCEDCDVAELATEDSPRYSGVAPWAVNEESALRLWTLSEEMVGSTF